MRRAARTDANHTEIVSDYPVWKCATCSVEARGTVHQMRKTYCSKSCMATGYATRLAGENNPNFRSAGLKVCEYCRCEFSNYNKKRKFCSLKCRDMAKPRKAPTVQIALPLPKPAKPPRQPVEPKKRVYTCQNCRNPYEAYPSAGRVFCTYQCFKDSGGPFRAGMAASQATMKYGAKKDANHADVFDEMRKHCPVYDLSVVGRGVPDGVAWAGGQWRLFDVKNPKTGYGRRGLNPIQKKWLEQWKGGPVYLIYTVEEARLFGQGVVDGLKCFSGGAVMATTDDGAIGVKELEQ